MDQLASGWALLVEDAASAFTPPDRRAASMRAPSNRLDRATAHDSSSAEGSPRDSLDPALRRWARQAKLRHAPIEFTAQVLVRLPDGPPPFDAVPLSPYAHLREHAPLVVGTLSFSALLMFGSTWLLAVVEPSLAFAILASLVSLVIVVAEGLRFAWLTATGAASNPVTMLVAMSSPLLAFLVVANYRTRWQDHRLGGA